MQLNAYGITDPGKIRSVNEDAYLTDLAHGLFVVADGLGGLPEGDKASQRIVEQLGEYPKLNGNAPELATYIESVNAKLTAEGQNRHPFTGWGSTLTLCWINETICRIVHVGDSAVFHFRNNDMKKLTIDHTMEHQYIRKHGEASRSLMPEEYTHTLTRCMGQDDTIRLDQKYIQLAPKDRILLCTDGLSKFVPADEIQRTIYTSSSPKEAATTLVQLANNAGGGDNITAIVIEVA